MLFLLGSVCFGCALYLLGKFRLSFANIDLVFPEMNAWQASAFSLLLYISSGGYGAFLTTFNISLPSNSRYLLKYIKFKICWTNLIIPSIFYENVAKNPNKIAFIYQNRNWTFADIDEFSNRVAHYILKKGFKKNDSITVITYNWPEYVAIWMGCAKINILCHLISSELCVDDLQEYIQKTKSRALICADFQQNIEEITGIQKWLIGSQRKVVAAQKGIPSANDTVDFDCALSLSCATPVAQLGEGKRTDEVVHVSDASNDAFTHASLTDLSLDLHFAGLLEDDVIFCSVKIWKRGGIGAVLQVIVHNCTVVFSNEKCDFWTQIKTSLSTVLFCDEKTCSILLNDSKILSNEDLKPVRLILCNDVNIGTLEKMQNRFDKLVRKV